MPVFPIFAALLGLLMTALPAHAGDRTGTEAARPLLKIVKTFRLQNPVGCTIGKDCWVLNYPDTGTENDSVATDTACGARSYEGHKGTDIAIDGRAAMQRGFNVLAAHDGTVLRVRDGEEDHFPVTEDQLAKIKADKKECGNAVLVDHGDGWQAMYCHMKRGSIIVTQQQKLKAGDKIGEVGASGMTEFPHLHFGLTHNGIVIDPFTARDIKEPCGGARSASLFSKASGLDYEPLIFMKEGFHDGPVTLDQIDAGNTHKENITRNPSALVFYSVMLGVRKDDSIVATITAPDGKIFATSQSTANNHRARHMVFVGRKVPESNPLQAGSYTAEIKVIRARDGEEPQKFSRKRTVTVSGDQ